MKVILIGNVRIKYWLSLDGDKIDDLDGIWIWVENLGIFGNKLIKKWDEIGFEVGGKWD